MLRINKFCYLQILLYHPVAMKAGKAQKAGKAGNALKAINLKALESNATLYLK